MAKAFNDAVHQPVLDEAGYFVDADHAGDQLTKVSYWVPCIREYGPDLSASGLLSRLLLSEASSLVQ